MWEKQDFHTGFDIYWWFFSSAGNFEKWDGAENGAAGGKQTENGKKTKHCLHINQQTNIKINKQANKQESKKEINMHTK